MVAQSEAPAVVCTPNQGSWFKSRPSKQFAITMSWYETSPKRIKHSLAHQKTTRALYGRKSHSKCFFDIPLNRNAPRISNLGCLMPYFIVFIFIVGHSLGSTTEMFLHSRRWLSMTHFIIDKGHSAVNAAGLVDRYSGDILFEQLWFFIPSAIIWWLFAL